MTTYGTIPTSSSPPVVNFEYVSRAKERLKDGLGTRRPWKEMFNYHCIGLPANVSDGFSRIKSNLAYFRMNYAIVVLLILFLSLLWHPISLIVLAFIMTAWIFLYFLRDEPLLIVGRMINDRVVLIVLSVVTLVLLLLTGATSNILSAVSIGVVVVLLHAVFRKTDDLYLDEEAAGFLNDAAAVRVPPPRGSS